MDLRINPEKVFARERGNPRKGIFTFLAVAIAFLTVILLINPATTEEYRPICGVEVHTHGEGCFETVDKLICELEEKPGHIHGDSCWAIEQTCVCGLEENDEHVHTHECIVEERILICDITENQVFHRQYVP